MDENRILRDALAAFASKAKPLSRHHVPVRSGLGPTSGLSRRDVMALGGAASLSATPGEANASIWSASRSSLRLNSGGKTWQLNASMFGRKARIVTTGKPAAPVWTLVGAKLPGTDWAILFRLTVVFTDDVPRIRISTNDSPTTELDLQDWIAGVSVLQRPNVNKIAVGLSSTLAGLAESSLRVAASQRPGGGGLTFKFETLGAHLRFMGPRLQFTTAKVTLESAPTTDSVDQILGASTGSSATWASWSETVARSDHTLSGQDAIGIELSSTDGHLEACDKTSGGRRAVAFLSSKAAVIELCTPPSKDLAPLKIRLGNVNLVGPLESDRTMVMRANLAGRKQGLQDRDLVAVVEAGPDPFHIYLTQKLERLEIPLNLLTIHAPVHDASTCDIHFPGMPALLTLTTGRPQIDDTRPRQPRLEIGQGSAFKAPLDGAWIRVRRTPDLLDLDFQFVSHAVWINHGNTKLRRYARGSAPPRRIVRFGPQHLEEEVFRAPSPDKPGGEAKAEQSGGRHLDNSLDRSPTLDSYTPSPIEKTTLKLAGSSKGPLSYLARFRMAGASRLVFMDKDEDDEFDLTIEYLTNWAALALVVNRRAMPDGLTMDEELKRIEFRGQRLSDLTQGMRDIAIGIIQKSLGPPSEHETSLEVQTGLMFSPDARAVFKATAAPPAFGPARIWNARLDPAHHTVVRAIWSAALDKQSFLGNSAIPNFTQREAKPGAQFDPANPFFETAIRSEALRDLVVQTSLFGLPALRRLDANGADSKGTMVFRPPKDYYLSSRKEPRSPTSPFRPYSEGFLRPTPLDRFEVSLGPQMATFTASWNGEPIGPVQVQGDEPRLNDFLPDALNLEQYFQNANLGRDTLVRVADKGFLVPQGFRVSYIELSQRLQNRFEGASDGQPVAYEIKRDFLVATKPRKLFPALYQPYDGRDAGGRVKELVTIQTPDIVASEEDSFWPRLAADPSQDVIWEYRVDGEAKAVRAPMLFVKNSAAHNPKKMLKIVEDFNKLTDESGRALEQHSGADRTYAPEQKPGEATFPTYTVRVGARGRFDQTKDGQREVFSIDGYMEGADQPPFYPFIARAEITVPPLERFLGRSPGRVVVGYDEAFVRHGFDAKLNPSELMLRVITPDIELDVSGQGNASGGVAKPNARLAALSRASGFVGGRAVDARTPSDATMKQAVTSAPSNPTSFNVDAAAAGRFDPAEFFGGALMDAKLLGVVPLRDVIQASLMNAAPRLREVQQFGLSEDAKLAVTSVVAACHTTAKQLTDARSKVDAAAGVGVFQSLYPTLSSKIDTFFVETQPVPGQSVLELGVRVTKIAAAGKEILTAVAALTQNPFPPGLAVLVRTLPARWTELAGALNNAGSLGAVATSLWQAAIPGLCTAAANHGLVRSLFGIPQQTFGDFAVTATADFPPPVNRSSQLASCSHFSQTPSVFQSGSREALFYEQITRPLLEAALGGETPGPAALLASAGDSVSEVVLAGLRVNVAGAELARDPVLSTAAQTLATTLLNGAARTFTRNADDRVLSPTDVASALAPTKPAVVEILSRLPLDLDRAISGLSATRLVNIQQTQAAEAALTNVLAQRFVDTALANARAADVTRSRNTVELTGASMAQLGLIFAHLTQRRPDQNPPWVVDRQTVDSIGADIIRRVSGVIASIPAPKVASTAIQDPDGQNRVLTRGQRLFDAAESLRKVLENAPDANAWTTWCEANLLKNMVSFVVGSLPSTLFAPTDSPVIALQAALDKLTVASALGNPRVAAATVALARVKAAAQRAYESFGRYQTLCRQVQSVIPNSAAERALLAYPGHAVDAVSDALLLRMEISSALQELAVRLMDINGANLGDVLQGDGHKSIELAAQQSIAFIRALTTLDSIPSNPNLAKSTQDSLAIIAAKPLDSAGVTAATEGLISYLRLADRSAAAAAMITAVLPPDVAGPLVRFANNLEDQAAAILLVPHQLALRILSGFDSANAYPALMEMQSTLQLGDSVSLLQGATRQLITDCSDLALGGDRNDFISRFQSGQSGLQIAAQTLATFASRANLSQLLGSLDAKAIEAELRSTLAHLIPIQTTQTYDFDTSLSSFPTGDPIFSMDPDAQSDPDADGGEPINDLVIHTSVEINFGTGVRRVTSRGSVRPFKIHLLGDQLDLLTVGFSGAVFNASAGASPSFRADVRQVWMGSMLQFIKPLEEYMGGKSGPYVLPGPTGIEVGYRFASDPILVGGLTFLNIALEASMNLAFDDRPAEFRFAFASRQKPFLITSNPYGGGGFVALTANARGIKTFELQLEFGAIIAIKFGPLTGQGRVTAGLYLLSGPGGRVFEGFVHAVGEGQIACFGICVNIEVCVRSSGSDMHGTSSYSFSFSLGLATVEYHFTAAYTVHGGSGNSTALAGASFIPLSLDMESLPDWFPSKTHKICRRVPHKNTAWNQYRRYFDLS